LGPAAGDLGPFAAHGDPVGHLWQTPLEDVFEER
jgi:hypothetical protein